MVESQILFACVDNCCYFKLVGELRYTNASGMDDLVERLSTDEFSCQQLVIDLNEVCFMDSTYLGLLASLARYCQQRDLPKATVFSSLAEINHLLASLCLDQAFDMVNQPTDKDLKLSNIVEQYYSDEQKGQMILKAHEALILLNDKNKSAFQVVVDALKKQL